MAKDQWGTCLAREKLKEVVLIENLDPQPYFNEHKMEQMLLALEEEVTPEAGNKYIQASIMLPHRNTFTWGTVVSCKHNAVGKIICCNHDNLILDTHLYDIEFADDKVTALTANIISKSMYSQCDPDGNDYICLDKLIDIRCMVDAHTLDQQQLLVNNTTCQHKSTKGWFICCQ